MPFKDILLTPASWSRVKKGQSDSLPAFEVMSKIVEYKFSIPLFIFHFILNQS